TIPIGCLSIDALSASRPRASPHHSEGDHKGKICHRSQSGGNGSYERAKSAQSSSCLLVLPNLRWPERKLATACDRTSVVLEHSCNLTLRHSLRNMYTHAPTT